MEKDTKEFGCDLGFVKEVYRKSRSNVKERWLIGVSESKTLTTLSKHGNRSHPVECTSVNLISQRNRRRFDCEF